MKDDDALSETTALAALRKQLADASLKSSARILILASLALNRKMTFMNLLTVDRHRERKLELPSREARVVELHHDKDQSYLQRGPDDDRDNGEREGRLQFTGANIELLSKKVIALLGVETTPLAYAIQHI